MKNIKSMHFKEETPTVTVMKLLDKLHEMGLEVEEDWGEESYVGTYSLRITFKGTDIGTNGKGCTKEYARASAYAELFERFQNGLLSTAMISPMMNDKFDFRVDPDEKHMSSMDLAKQNDPFIQYYFKLRNMENSTVEEKAKNIYEVNRLEYLTYNKDDDYVCLPFYDVRSKQLCYLPKWIYQKYYGSNGMAAGNTFEEAMVQGIAEIIERMVQKRLFKEKICFPDVPESYMRKYPYIYDMFKKLKDLDGYRVFMKDCSFGGKYPVAALVVLQINTGKYGIKIGCHPDFGVAMERTFTEAAQGNDILEYVNRSVIDFFNSNVDNEDNICNSFKIGLAQYPYEIFNKEADYEFVPVKDVSQLDNKEMLNMWIKELLEDGYDVLVRDVSFMGFPSCHVIIPGISEMRDETDTTIRAENTRAFTSGLLMYPSKISARNAKYILGSLNYHVNRIFESTLSTYVPNIASKNLLPMEKYSLGSQYLASMLYFMIGDYEKSLIKMKEVLNSLNSRGIEDERNEITSYSYYLSLRIQGFNHEEAMYYIELMFDKEICKKTQYIFSDPEMIIKKQYTDFDRRKETIDEKSKFYFNNRINDILRSYKMNHPISQQISAQHYFAI